MLDKLRVRAGYERAAEAALGAACEAVMVENADALEKIVAELGDSGALAFTDLTAANREEIKPADTDAKPARGFWSKLSALFAAKGEAAAPSDSTLPLMSQFVQCDEAVKKLAGRILDGFLFVENADEALAITRVRADRHIVTRMGEVWYREGWQLRGKARDGKQSVLQYENQLAALQKQTAALEQGVADADSGALRFAADVDTKRASLAATQRRRQELEAQLSAAQYEEKGFVRQREDAGNRLQAV
ncbi:MAG: hypothetical protein LBD30_07000, partial [Verrucomicrobiales bacterium]|nr:hypothetical protein [Verrucomicrobiales bacterium]